MNVIFIGDIVGEGGRVALKRAMPQLREKFLPDFFVVNGENAAGGNGITPRLAIDLMRCGVDVITLGDHAWDQKEIMPFFETEPRLIRPYNYPPGAPGQGHVVVSGNGKKLAVLNAQGRTFMRSEVENPFLSAEALVKKLKEETNCILVDFHAEATSEKVAFGRLLEGQVSAVFGTHTHIPTADACILNGGTAYMTDVGMTGSYNSVIGRDVGSVIARYKTLLPQKWHLGRDDLRACGVCVEIDEQTGSASVITPFQIYCGSLDSEQMPV